MRIEINLNKEKQRRRSLGLSLKHIRPGRFIKAPPMLLTILGGCVLVFMIVMHFYQNYRLDSLGDEIEFALADSTALSTTIQVLKDIRLKKQEMLQRIEVVKTIEEQRYALPKLMDHVSNALPEFLWMNRWMPVESENDSTGAWFELQGESFSNIRVAEFMINLKKSPLIEDVILIKINEKIDGGISTMVFTLRCRFADGKKT